MFYCAFHVETELKGLGVYQLTLGDRSVLVCGVCAETLLEHGITLSGQ
jgi:hypothetical protein